MLVSMMEILFATSITYNMTNGEGIVMLELKMKRVFDGISFHVAVW